MITVKKNYYLLMILFFVISCTNKHHIDVETALQLSKDNRAELQKVLDYYDKSGDPQKLIAAKFLIRNMIGHYSVAGAQMDCYKREIDSVLANKSPLIRAMYYHIAAREAVKSGDFSIEYDLHHIKADYLIWNIEASFDIWNKNDRGDVSFDTFCEYILPYRVDNEPLSRWKDTAFCQSNIFSYLKENTFSIKNLRDYVTDNAALQDEITSTPFINSFLKDHAIDCIDLSYNNALLYNLFGIPTCIEYVPHYPSQENRHFWTVSIAPQYANNGLASFVSKTVAKVYRKTFSINELLIDEANYIPQFFEDPFKRDVTELYNNTANLIYDFGSVDRGIKYGYLSVFNNQDWQEVAYSEFQRGKLTFEGMGRDVIYMPVYYAGAKRIYGQYPVLLDLDGVSKELKPDKNNTQKLVLKRKYGYNLAGDYAGRTLVGTKVVATNDIEAKTYDTIAMVTRYSYMNYDSLYTNSKKAYKYWFVMPVSGKYNEFADVVFLDEQDNVLRGILFGLDAQNQYMDDVSGIYKIFDDDILTYAHTGNGAGMYFDEPVTISKVKYISRNDDNGVQPGEEYELFYFDQGNWVSMGRKVAVSHYIEYDDAPTNALFWLRNHTKGKEERPFTVVDGRIRYW